MEDNRNIRQLWGGGRQLEQREQCTRPEGHSKIGSSMEQCYANIKQQSREGKRGKEERRGEWNRGGEGVKIHISGIESRGFRDSPHNSTIDRSECDTTQRHGGTRGHNGQFEVLRIKR